MVTFTKVLDTSSLKPEIDKAIKDWGAASTSTNTKEWAAFSKSMTDRVRADLKTFAKEQFEFAAEMEPLLKACKDMTNEALTVSATIAKEPGATSDRLKLKNRFDDIEALFKKKMDAAQALRTGLVAHQGFRGDLFETANNFYGVNLGSQVRWQKDWLFLSAYGKVALGSTEEKLRIQGSTTLVTPTGNQTAPGGILALPSNIGNYSRSVFGVVPEAGLTLGIEPIRHVRATLGYSFLYWNNVLRPGAQIDRIVNPGQVPTDSNFGVNNAGPHPIVDLMDKSFRVHTLNVGLELYY